MQLFCVSFFLVKSYLNFICNKDGIQIVMYFNV